MPSSVVSAIDSTLQHHHDKDSEMKLLFKDTRNVAQNGIADLLSDFRHKRAIGLVILLCTETNYCFVQSSSNTIKNFNSP